MIGSFISNTWYVFWDQMYVIIGYYTLCSYLLQFSTLHMYLGLRHWKDLEFDLLNVYNSTLCIAGYIIHHYKEN